MTAVASYFRTESDDVVYHVAALPSEGIATHAVCSTRVRPHRPGETRDAAGLPVWAELCSHCAPAAGDW